MEAIKKKKECNAKAQAVVMKLLDPIEDVNELLKMVRGFVMEFSEFHLIFYYFRWEKLINATMTTSSKSEQLWNCAAIHYAKERSKSKLDHLFTTLFHNLVIFRLPKQLFHISTITKTVYELADRRNFCSGHCMRSSNYIKVQLLTSPLWMRDNEVIPDFKLLSLK